VKTPASQQNFDQLEIANSPRDDEIIWGAVAIGGVIRRNPRQVYYLHETGAIPTKLVGGRICAKRGKLLAIAD
jgi:hypothetical protein